MSYPRQLHILIIEDESQMIEGYNLYFNDPRGPYQGVELFFARSFADATKLIESSKIFHVAIVDLNLPMNTRENAAEGLAPGEQLLAALAKRDGYPVPVVLVVSGKLNLAQPLSGLQESLEHSFWHGRLVNKGEGEYHEIEAGIAKALEYVDVGIHLQDSNRGWFPTLSPREEDLLRRCILAQELAIGVDIQWWSAESGRSLARSSPNRGPTKVLVGNFLMDDGMGASRATFFKFEPAGDGISECRNIAILGQKLAHVKALSAVHSRGRSLIVTQSVTTRGFPVPLNEYLRRKTDEVGPTINSVVAQVVEQLGQLGDQSEDEIPVSAFLWECLNRVEMERAWGTCETRELESPLDFFDGLRASNSRLWATRRACTHGDLNATNVAIDDSQTGKPQAYIFDAGWMQQDIEFRDLATLEVTTVLFNCVGTDENLLLACKRFYDSDFLPDYDPTKDGDFTRNVQSMIVAIRSRFTTDDQKVAYALLVFGAALQQLFGMGVQPSPNKIANPLHACQLASWAGTWVRNITPHLTDVALVPVQEPITHMAIPSA